MTEEELKTRLQRELPALLRQDADFRGWLEQLIRDLTVPRTAFEERFERVMDELAAARKREEARWKEHLAATAAERAREEIRWDRHVAENQARWDKHLAENQARWDKQFAESQARWEKQVAENHAIWAEIKAAREREALKGILEDSFGVEVLNINDYDDEGLVFGRPEQVEIDIIVHNGAVIACELKSSMSKGDMYIFARKVDFYERRHRRPVERRIVISPMVHPSARPVAERLGIEVFAYAEDTAGLDRD
jgi:hypothetical protein